MKIFLSTLVLFCISCTESSTDSFTFIQNNSNHTINIYAYKNGAITPDKSFTIAPSEKIQIDHTSNGGTGGSGISYSMFIGGQDSILVTFDNLNTIVHYKETLIGNSTKFYPYNSPRNLYNPVNYTRTIMMNNSHSTIYNFLYTFTEQDFIDASQ